MSVQQPSNGNGKPASVYMMIVAILLTWALSTLTTWATGLSSREQNSEVDTKVSLAQAWGEINTLKEQVKELRQQRIR